MTVGELITELQKFPLDMPVAVYEDIYSGGKSEIEITQRTWVHTNHPYDKPEFDYVDLT